MLDVAVTFSLSFSHELQTLHWVPTCLVTVTATVTVTVNATVTVTVTVTVTMTACVTVIVSVESQETYVCIIQEELSNRL